MATTPEAVHIPASFDDVVRGTWRPAEREEVNNWNAGWLTFEKCDYVWVGTQLMLRAEAIPAPDHQLDNGVVGD